MLIPSFLTGIIDAAGNIVAKVIHRHGSEDDLSGEVPMDGQVYMVADAAGNYTPRMGDGSTVLGQIMPVAHAHGTYGWSWLYVGAIPSDGETLVIGDDTYEMDTNSSVTGDNIAVDISGAGDTDDVIDAIVSAIRASATGDYGADDDKTNHTVFIYAKHVGSAGNLTITENFASASIVLRGTGMMGGSADMVGGTDPVEVKAMFYRHTVHSKDVDLGLIYVPLPSSPANGPQGDYQSPLLYLQAAWTDSSNVSQGDVTVTYVTDLVAGYRVVVTPAAGSFSAGDIIHIFAWYLA